MCMGGGGGSPATIVMPNTGAYDQMANAQIAAMQSAQSGSAQLMQSKLDAALRGKADLLTQLRDIKQEKASNASALDEQARRLSVLVGAPPPEPTAKAPAVGADRNDSQGNVRKRGKSSLRIERPTASSSGQGAGLNIT